MKFNFWDFFSQVLITTFIVIMLMMIIEFINVKTRGKLLVLIEKYPKIQILAAALLGLIPGCVGIFAVVSLYTHRLVTFGALLAAAITSFGDEAFFMFAFIPKQTLILVCILFGIAIAAGYIADWILRHKTLQPIDNEDVFALHQHDNCTTHTHKEHKYIFGKLSLIRVLTIVLVGMFMLGILTGFLGHNHSISEDFSISIHNHSDSLTSACDGEHAQFHISLSMESIVFLLIALFAFILLLTVNNHFFEEHIWDHVIKKHFLKIFIWVFAIMLLIEIVKFFIDIETFSYSVWGSLILLFFALLIAILPESGPNLIILFLFIDGIVPFSTLIANSIVQEGHGGLPLIAEKPKDFFILKLIKFGIALFIGLLGLYVGF